MKSKIIGLVALSSICFGAEKIDWQDYIKSNENQVHVEKFHVEKITLSKCPSKTVLGSKLDLKHNENGISKSTVFQGCLDKDNKLIVIESEVEYPAKLPYDAANRDITNYPFLTDYNANIFINTNVSNVLMNPKENK